MNFKTIVLNCGNGSIIKFHTAGTSLTVTSKHENIKKEISFDSLTKVTDVRCQDSKIYIDKIVKRQLFDEEGKALRGKFKSEKISEHYVSSEQNIEMPNVSFTVGCGRLSPSKNMDKFIDGSCEHTDLDFITSTHYNILRISQK